MLYTCILRRDEIKNGQTDQQVVYYEWVMLLNGGVAFLLLSYLVAVKNSRSIACTSGMLILPQYESLVLLLAAFLELVTNLQCEKYFGRYG